MGNGHKLDLSRLQKKVTALSDALAHLGSADDLRKLILILKRPGWTTPAEFLFATAIVDSMQAHADAMTDLKGKLLKASDAVGQ